MNRKSKLQLNRETVRNLARVDLKLARGGLPDGSWRDFSCDVCDNTMPSVCPFALSKP